MGDFDSYQNGTELYQYGINPYHFGMDSYQGLSGIFWMPKNQVLLEGLKCEIKKNLS